MTAAAEAEATIPDQLAVFRKQDAIVAALKKYMELKIGGVNDKKGLAAVHAARIEARDARIAVEKTRKKLNEEALAWQKKVNAEAKRVTAEIEPVETYLQEQEDAIEAEKQRIRDEAEAKRKAVVKQRYDALQAVGYTGDLTAVPEMSDEHFSMVLSEAADAKAERDRIAAEEAQRQAAEQERLRKLEAEQAEARRKAEEQAAEQRRKEQEAMAAERARLAEIQKQQEAEAAKLRAEQERIAAEKAEHERQVAIEKARQEAAERAKRETEERIAREAAERKAAEERKAAQAKAESEAAEAARIKAEQERPHREKILAIADAIDAMKSPEGPKHDAVALALSECAVRIRGIANGKTGKP